MGDCNSFILSGLWGIDGRVLIVPSGIETQYEPREKDVRHVLIVPSGIETTYRPHWHCLLFVLIVPSGIETTFNATAMSTVSEY